MNAEEKLALISRCRCRIELTDMILRNHRPDREMRKILETEMRVFQIALAALTAPALSLTELVPPEMTNEMAAQLFFGKAITAVDVWNTCRAAILRNIEEAG